MKGRNLICCCEASSGLIETGVSWKVEKVFVGIFKLLYKICMNIHFVNLLQKKLQNKFGNMLLEIRGALIFLRFS